MLEVGLRCEEPASRLGRRNPILVVGMPAQGAGHRFFVDVLNLVVPGPVTCARAGNEPRRRLISFHRSVRIRGKAVPTRRPPPLNRILDPRALAIEGAWSDPSGSTASWIEIRNSKVSSRESVASPPGRFVGRCHQPPVRSLGVLERERPL